MRSACFSHSDRQVKPETCVFHYLKDPFKGNFVLESLYLSDTINLMLNSGLDIFSFIYLFIFCGGGVLVFVPTDLRGNL